MNQPRGIVILRCSLSLPTADGIFRNRSRDLFDNLVSIPGHELEHELKHSDQDRPGVFV